MTAQTTWQRVAEDVCARITSGETPIGEKIPSQQQLAIRHGVAIGTVKRAVLHLTAAGVLEGRAGSGSFVKRMPTSDDLAPSLTLAQRVEQLERAVAELKRRQK